MTYITNQRQWINVQNELPDDDTMVLVYTPDESDSVWIGYVDGDVWRSSEGGIIAPTRWMQFPDPPA